MAKECPVCGMDGLSEYVGDREWDGREYSVMRCSYCGYRDDDSFVWLDEIDGYDDEEDEDEAYYYSEDDEDDD